MAESAAGTSRPAASRSRPATVSSGGYSGFTRSHLKAETIGGLLVYNLAALGRL
jgi:hypothetical protein